MNEELENPSTITSEYKGIIDLFIEAIDKRVPDGITSLLDDNKSNEIIHIAQEYGKEIF